jgi:hypothetical protein
MKSRTGFVSNSSSSSFLIVGINRWANKELFKQIMEADGRDDDSFELCYGTETSKSGLGYYGYDNEPSYLGMDIASLLETKTLPELRLHFCGFIQHKFGIDIDPKQVELHYGQVGSG